MSRQEKSRWKDWADRLRQELMTGLKEEVTKSVDCISSETETTKAESTLRSARFWRDCQRGKSPNDTLAKAGFDIEFRQDEGQHVREVTLRLNETWLTILHRVLDDKKA